jgi:hypothetical protein
VARRFNLAPLRDPYLNPKAQYLAQGLPSKFRRTPTDDRHQLLCRTPSIRMRCRNHRPTHATSTSPGTCTFSDTGFFVYRFLHTVKREGLLACCRFCCPLRLNPQRLVVLENGLMVSHEPPAVDGFRHLANGRHAAKIRNDLGDNKTPCSVQLAAERLGAVVQVAVRFLS